MNLRPYQTDTIAKVRAAIAAGSRRIGIVMPTGAGKTRTLAAIASASVARGRRVLWLAHRTELVDQAVEALVAAGLQVGTVSPMAQAGPQPFAPVQVATVQTLISRGELPPADIIVPDEFHHFCADTFIELLRSYPDAYVLGPTATPERSDGRGLGQICTRLIIGARVRELVGLGHLVPAEVIAPRDKLRTGQIAQRPIDAYLEHARGRRAIVFSGTVPLATAHAAEFRAAGFRAVVLSGTTPWPERRACLDALRAGELDALCNVYVATEGFDVPEISAVILARGFGSAGPYLQAVGRGLRPAPWTAKRNCLVLDLTGTTHVHGHPEDDRQYSLEGRGIQRDVDAAAVNQPYCRVCGAPIVGGESCTECGTAPRSMKPPVVTGEKLVRYAAKRAEAPDARAATLRRWTIEGRSRGFKPGWAYAKYRAVYGSSPSLAIIQAARGSALHAPGAVSDQAAE